TAQPDAWVSFDVYRVRARVLHLHRAREHLLHIVPRQRARHHSEVREGRVSPAYVGRVREDPAKPMLLGQLLERRPRIRDRRELRPSLALPTSWRGAMVNLVPEIGEVRQRLRGLA